ncbi:MAG: hypothetical protein EVA70_04685 [Parvularculaceae bacterium]|nr:MAG: hypothetical protein EVA70_04685 [Parvularculaceae bacterium]
MGSTITRIGGARHGWKCGLCGSWHSHQCTTSADDNGAVGPEKGYDDKFGTLIAAEVGPARDDHCLFEDAEAWRFDKLACTVSSDKVRFWQIPE